KYPAQHDDCFDVLKFLDDDDLDMSKSMLPKNADLTRVFVVGDSAGGNLAHHVAYRACGFEFKRLKVCQFID
ncbi:probable carboxylesterase 18, partial [Tanacetum coccineum]